jgi:hypothetical protein
MAVEQMSRAVRAARDALSNRSVCGADELDLATAQMKGLAGQLSVADRALLVRAHAIPLNVDDFEADAYQLLWMVFHKLVNIWVDPRDRVWVRTTRLGIEVAKAAKAP